MSAKNFKFVSPGVFIKEIDLSGIEALPEGIGPVVIGRTLKGPAMRPVQVNSRKEFVDVFGLPVPGHSAGDVWRRPGGSNTGPTYASYAAMAWLKNNSPITVVRLLGTENIESTAAGKAGWQLSDASTDSQNFVPTAAEKLGASNDGGGAYGLFVAPATKDNGAAVTGTLAAVWYLTEGHMALEGTAYDDSGTLTGLGKLVQSDAAQGEFTVEIRDKDYSNLTPTLNMEKVRFNFNKSSAKYIRKAFNTTPHVTNGNLTSDTETYWLGESYDQHVKNKVLAISSSAGDQVAFLAALQQGSAYSYGNFKYEMQAAQSPWVIAQHMGVNTDYDATNPAKFTKLFRFVALESGPWDMHGMKISIRDIKRSYDPNNPFGSFTVEIRKVADRDNARQVVEVYEECNLNPSSPNFIARKIGDRRLSWDEAERRNKTIGRYRNKSTLVRVDLKKEVEQGTATSELLPFGFVLPSRLRTTRFVDHTTNPRPISGDPSLSSALLAAQVPFEFEQANVISGSNAPTSATAVNAIDTTDMGNDTLLTFTLAAAGGGTDSNGGVTEIFFDAGETANPVEGANRIGIGSHDSQSDKTLADLLIHAINGTTTHNVDAANGGTNGATGGIPGITATSGSTDTQVTLTVTQTGVAGNAATITSAVTPGLHLIVDVGAFTGGVDGDHGLEGLGANTNDEFRFEFPQLLLRTSASDGGFNEVDEPYWGWATGQGVGGIGSPADLNFDYSIYDLLRSWPSAIRDSRFLDNGTEGASNIIDITGSVFSLDDIVVTEFSAAGDKPKSAHYVNNSRRSGIALSNTAVEGGAPSDLDGWKKVIENFNKFTMPVYGGHDGLDVREQEPFGSHTISGLAAPDKDLKSYEYNSIKRAIDMVRDAEAIDMNLLCVPGVVDSSLNNHIVDTCETRGDALAVIDLDGGYTPATETANEYEARLGNVNSTVNNFLDSKINSSYGATYYPWCQIFDGQSGAEVIVPPSVVAMGAISKSEASSFLWFAPAGFNRGGLSSGEIGYPVTNTVEKLTSKERDKLYAANINPIASFPSEGIVIFGQKTLQLKQSALDRINVRRLLIFVKKEISRMANSILFDPNVQVTWNRFISKVDPFLRGIKTNFGLVDFKVILDESTTTPDLIDRNVLYAKVFLKPTKAIEFIAIDFLVTGQGASFDD